MPFHLIVGHQPLTGVLSSRCAPTKDPSHPNRVLDVERRVAGAGDRAAGPASEVHPDRQVVLHCRLVDLPGLAPPQRLGGTDQQQHLHEARVGCDPVDLAGRQLAVLVGDVDRRARGAARDRAIRRSASR